MRAVSVPGLAAVRSYLSTFRGIATLYVALAILVALLGLIVLAARQKQTSVRGYGTFYFTRNACYVDQKQRLNVTRCVPVSANVFLVEFGRSIGKSVPIVSRSTCCPGTTGAAIVSDRSVQIAFGAPRRYPIVASLLIP